MNKCNETLQTALHSLSNPVAESQTQHPMSALGARHLHPVAGGAGEPLRFGGHVVGECVASQVDALSESAVTLGHRTPVRPVVCVRPAVHLGRRGGQGSDGAPRPTAGSGRAERRPQIQGRGRGLWKADKPAYLERLLVAAHFAAVAALDTTGRQSGGPVADADPHLGLRLRLVATRRAAASVTRTTRH